MSEGLNVPIWGWGAFLLLIVALLAFDLGVFGRKDRAIGVRTSLLLSAFYIALALVFGGGVWWLADGNVAFRYLTAFVIEKSLSLDNIFVFVVIFRAFEIPEASHHRVLFWGVLGAIVVRGIFIALGLGLLHLFEWFMFVFGVFLIVSGGRILFLGDKGPGDPKQSRFYRMLERHMPLISEFENGKLFTRRYGRRVATPLFAALVTIEATDVMFALDSIPAVFTVTRDPFIVFTSNIFAVLGLRALYFALRELVERLRYVERALALLLVAIGVKMVVGEFIDIPVWVMLSITLAILVGGVVLSLLKGSGDKKSRGAEATSTR